MTQNEIELFNIINENDNPEEAIRTALELISAFSTLREAPQDTSSVSPQVVA